MTQGLQTLKLLNLDGDETIVAQYNPKEVGIDIAVPWSKVEKRGAADLEYTGGEDKTMSFELLFDTFEQGTSVRPMLHALEQLTRPVDAHDLLSMPPRVMVIWGTDEHPGEGLQRFVAVVLSVGIKCTMFAPDGKVVRATANVKLRRVNSLAEESKGLKSFKDAKIAADKQAAARRARAARR